jgi:hypothetical protein
MMGNASTRKYGNLQEFRKLYPQMPDRPDKWSKLYLFLMHRQGVAAREEIFNWPMGTVAGAVAPR